MTVHLGNDMHNMLWSLRDDKVSKLYKNLLCDTVTCETLCKPLLLMYIYCNMLKLIVELKYDMQNYHIILNKPFSKQPET